MMSRKVFAVALLFAALAPLGLASPVAAQAQKGDQEVQLFGSLNNFVGSGDDGGKDLLTMGNLFVNVGQYLTDAFEVGGGPNLMFAAGAGGGTSFDVGLNAFVRYYLGAQSARVKPYVGSEYFLASVKENVADQQYIQATFGVKNYFSERAAIDFTGAYGFVPTAMTEVQVFTFRTGLTVLF